MRIAWITPTAGMFGAIREFVEVSNVLVSRGHDVTIYHPDGGPCKWLPCTAKFDRLMAVHSHPHDVVIGVTDWKRDQHAILDAATAKVKVVCVLGFTPTPELAAVWSGHKRVRDAGDELQRSSLHTYHVLTDSSWQNAWLKANVGIDALPPMGGINLDQFHPVPKTHSKAYFLLGMTGDPRARKGTDTVLRAFNLIQKSGIPVRMQSYWHKGIAQDKMRDWYSNCDIFLDAERSAGWANPVAESMACGAAVVSTDIGAVHDFAIQGETALLVPIDDAVEMANAAVKLMQDAALRKRLVVAGLERVKLFSYERIVPPLEKALQAVVDA